MLHLPCLLTRIRRVKHTSRLPRMDVYSDLHLHLKVGGIHSQRDSLPRRPRLGFLLRGSYGLHLLHSPRQAIYLPWLLVLAMLVA